MSQDAIKDLEDQINWRGPNGKVQGNIVINRTRAELLLLHIKGLNSLIKSLQGQMKAWNDYELSKKDIPQKDTTPKAT